ncbi:hypothetical protein GGTG_00136 [Gaeumannomyces tritici R3-111a-1]|uniref:Uncharacterized protein n=1 Tax=Gaeumannomyces tritici (strain R3-111a-1) TaxID=644352 RepID=J3NFU2_GAET3|nr:hypothetical protein GGTG_00136 [Gaeumannomyces tritici R3-111a-1]EJT80132.1 hypothetical protein GGTG_00136 [Gaeumannomyces tritici R3-111a-1]
MSGGLPEGRMEPSNGSETVRLSDQMASPSAATGWVLYPSPAPRVQAGSAPSGAVALECGRAMGEASIQPATRRRPSKVTRHSRLHRSSPTGPMGMHRSEASLAPLQRETVCFQKVLRLRLGHSNGQPTLSPVGRAWRKLHWLRQLGCGAQIQGQDRAISRMRTSATGANAAEPALFCLGWPPCWIRAAIFLPELAGGMLQHRVVGNERWRASNSQHENSKAGGWTGRQSKQTIARPEDAKFRLRQAGARRSTARPRRLSASRGVWEDGRSSSIPVGFGLCDVAARILAGYMSASGEALLFGPGGDTTTGQDPGLLLSSPLLLG